MSDEQAVDSMRAIFAQAPLAILVLDGELRLTDWNQAAAQMFGVPSAKAMGQSVDEFFCVTCGDTTDFWSTRLSALGTGELPGRVRQGNGASFPVRVLAAKLPGLLAEETTALYVVRNDGAQELEAWRASDQLQQKADLLNAIIDGELGSSEIAVARGRSLGLDLPARYALFAISIDDYQGKSFAELQKDQRSMKNALRQVTNICSAEQDKIVWTRYDGFAVLCPLPENCADIKGHAMARAKSGKERVIRQLPDIKLTVGVSSSYTDVLDISRCYREAKEAVNVGQRIWGGNGVYHYADLGICQLLSQFKDSTQLQAFVERSLGKLLRQDAAKGTQLVATLEEILSAANLKEAAERSFVHHKTILARKNKIEAILGVSIDDVETRLTLSTAMKILRLLPK